MTTEPHPAARTDRLLSVFLLSIVLSAAIFSSCKRGADADIDRFYKSLSIEHERLVWSLNVGVLNDGLRRELTRGDVEPILQSAVSRMATSCPRVSLRFIADQPLDADYIIDHTVRRRSLAARSGRESPVLFLTSTAEEVNRAKLKKSGVSLVSAQNILSSIRRAEKQKDTSGVEWLSNRSSGSAFVWRAYLREQVRYDVILTNAFIFPDQADAREPDIGPEGLQAALWEAEGRTAGEGTAGLVSLFRFAALEGGAPSAEAREAAVQRVSTILSRIVLGMATESLGGDSLPQVCIQREVYLRAAARFETGERKEACADLRRFILPPGAAVSPGEKALRAYCAKNG